MQLRPGLLTQGRPSSLTPGGGFLRLKLTHSPPPDLARRLAGNKTLQITFTQGYCPPQEYEFAVQGCCLGFAVVRWEQQWQHACLSRYACQGTAGEIF